MNCESKLDCLSKLLMIVLVWGVLAIFLYMGQWLMQ